MHIIRKSEIVQGVAKRWQERYFRNGKWTETHSGSSEEIHEQLLALGEDATEEQVTAIVGNDFWTRNKCSECDLDVDLTVHFREEPDYDAVGADVCPSCLRKAVGMLEATVEGLEPEGIPY